MWIESITVKGFRSFRDEEKITFDRHHTAIVGRNGSGKSSLLMALFYALQPRLRKTLRGTDGIFHHWNDNIMPQAQFVIVFNNEDRRFSTVDTDKIVLMWIMGTKSDILKVNGKACSLEKWGSLLANAGMSRENYFAIHQGETNRLAMASPTERLEMLEHFAGLADYYKKAEKSKKELETARQSLVNIDEQLERLGEEMDRLELEAEELTDYQAIIRKTKALSTVINKRELAQINDKLHALTGKRSRCEVESEKMNGERKVAIMKRDEIQSNLLTIETAIESLNREKDSIQEDLHFRTKELETIKTKFRSAAEQRKELENSLAKAKEESKEVQALIDEKQEDMKTVQNNFDKYDKFLDQVEGKITALERKTELFNYRGMYGNPEETKAIVDDLNAKLSDLKINMDKLSQKIDERKNDQTTMKNDLDNRIGEVSELCRNRSNLAHDLAEKQKEISGLSSEDKILQMEKIRRQEEFQLKLTTVNNNWQKLCLKAHSKPFLDSIPGIEKIMNHLRNGHDEEQWVIRGYRGVVASLIQCDPKIQLALSVALGNKIYSHVVTSAKVAGRILYWQKKLGLKGTYEFLPLDKIIPSSCQYPTGNRNVIPLLNKVHYAPDLEVAFHFLLNRKVLIRDLSHYDEVRDYKLDAITMDGEQHCGKGFLVGGYYKPSESKLALYKGYESAKQELENGLSALQESENKGRDIGALLTAKLDEKSKIENKIQYLDKEIEKGSNDRSLLVMKIKDNEEIIRKWDVSLREKKRTMEDYQSRIEQITKDEFSQTTQEESENQIQIIKELEVLKKKRNNAFKKKMSAEKELNAMKNELENILCPRLQELATISPSQPGRLTLNLETFSEEKKVLQETTKQLQDNFDAKNEELKNFYDQKEVFENELNTANEKVEETQIEHQRYVDKEEKINDQLNGLLTQRTSLEKRLVQDAIEDPQFSEYSTKQCLEAMKKLDKKLEKYKEKVNMKALDMQIRMKDDTKNFVKRRKDCGIGIEKTEALCENLEGQKFAKVDFTFKQVSKYFSEIFQILVPEGHGRLRIEPNGENNRPSAIDIEVSFNGGEATTELKHLSGGQKTLVALSYMFALQKADPSPIYIFDEIDCNLGTEPRKRVAQWLLNSRESTENIQFITTTFRRELVEHSNKIIGVNMLNGASRSLTLSKREALDFITQTDEV